MIDFSKLDLKDLDVIGDIAARAQKIGINLDVCHLNMDISAAHLNCPLKLDELLTADNFNFIHDVAGIQRHIDRETGELGDNFLPRFAQ